MPSAVSVQHLKVMPLHVKSSYEQCYPACVTITSVSSHGNETSNLGPPAHHETQLTGKDMCPVPSMGEAGIGAAGVSGATMMCD